MTLEKRFRLSSRSYLESGSIVLMEDGIMVQTERRLTELWRVTIQELPRLSYRSNTQRYQAIRIFNLAVKVQPCGASPGTVGQA